MRFKDFFRPTSVEGALAAYESSAHNAVYVAGCTDVLVAARESDRFDGKCAIDLTGIAALRQISGDAASLTIGAGCTHDQIAASPLVKRYAPALCAACASVGSPQIRHRGTLGGNIANASPAADTLAPLALLKASVCLRGPAGERTLPVTELVTGMGKTALLGGELLTAVVLPKPQDGWKQRFYKLGRREALAISRLTVCAGGRVVDGKIDDLRVSFGAAFSRPMLLQEVGAFAQGKAPTAALLRETAELAAAQIPKIAGVRASTKYKQPVSAKLLERELLQLFEVRSDG